MPGIPPSQAAGHMTIRLAKSRWTKNLLARGFFAMRSTQHQLAVARQLRFHLFVHLLIGNTGTPHFILMLYQNLAHFIVQAVLDGQLFHHALAHALRDRFGRLALNLFAFNESLDDFRGHMADIIANEQHSNVSFNPTALSNFRESSLLAAPIKCNSPRRFEYAATQTSANVGEIQEARAVQKAKKFKMAEKFMKRERVGRTGDSGRNVEEIDALRQCVDALVCLLYDELQRAVS